MKKTASVLLVTALVCAWAFAEESAKTVSLFNGKDFDGWKLFIPDNNVDPATVWSVNDGVIRCSGAPTGYMRTEKPYENYRLVVEWRWPGEGRNSGLLLHAQDPDKLWPLCYEAQLMHKRAGDIVAMGHGAKFKELPERESAFAMFVRKDIMAEKPLGEWNTFEVLCEGGTIELSVNGELVNKATGTSLKKGYIALQNEAGTPIEYRNVNLTPISK